jgi:hypothetical protein
MEFGGLGNSIAMGERRRNPNAIERDGERSVAPAPDRSVLIEVVRHQPLNLVRCDRIYADIEVDHIGS